MAAIFFNLIYLLLLAVISPALIYQRWKHGKYRDGWSQKLWGQLPQRQSLERQKVWLHAVSVGEVLQLQQVVRELRQRTDSLDILISTTTHTGYQVASEKFTDCEVAYFPLDFSWSVRNALRRVQPDLIVLVELELWPNFLSTAKQRGIPVVLINGRLSEKSFRGYKKLKWLFAKLLNQLNHIAVQSQEYRDRFIALGCRLEIISVTGSIKFDGVQTNRKRPPVEELREFFQLNENEVIFIAGSTQSPEEEMALEAYSSVLTHVPQARLIIVPRHPERGATIAKSITDAGFSVIQRSTGMSSGSGVMNVGLLDTVGELNDCWALADAAFVGGSFGDRGGQNMLEPAAYGAAVCFGPNTRNFRQIVELLKSQHAAETVQNQAELNQFVLRMLSDLSHAREMGSRAKQLVLAQQGATDKTVQVICDTLNASDQQGQHLENAA
ncbi:MAG: 3-deoxy-D-manno-octulosonic acid transferase [Planctomicrobium sp.]|nr:3-deoxy-D-manno-octulosonic acid transferase [Planctomicrobium sp.]